MELHRDIQRERLFFIEFLAYFTGQVSRKDIIVRFGISEAAATKDLSLYSELIPGFLNYDLRKKCYTYGGQQTHFTHDVDQALFSLAGDRAIAIDSEHAKRLPSWVDSSIKRKVDIQLVSTITRCIFQHSKMTADYVSLSKGERERLLSPLAIIHDGLRWHVRCFNHEKNDYRDYNLSRFKLANDSGTTDAKLDLDMGWNKDVSLKLIPHPNSEHPETIQMDYDINGSTKIITLKSCLVGYFLRHWNIDFSDNATGNPKANQLYLNNKDELLDQGVEPWSFEC